MSYLPGKFVWFEHVSSDTAKARKFYEPLFNWHTESMPMGSTRYPMILNGNDGIGGYFGDTKVEGPFWLGFPSGEDVGASFPDAPGAGGRAVRGPQEIPPPGPRAAPPPPFWGPLP